MGRGYLLPAGCKDLIDVLNLKSGQSQLHPAQLIDLSKLKLKLSPPQLNQLLDALKKLKQQLEPKQPFPSPPAPLPPIKGEMVVPAETTAAQLAALLGQKPFQIVADVMDLGFFVTANDPLSFEIIFSVARKHGFFAIKPAH